MSSPKSTTSSTLPFRSKKTLRSTSNSLLPDQKSMSSKTPEKPAHLSSRIRNRKAALSIKEVRRAAQSVRESNQQPSRDTSDGSKWVRMQIDSRQSGSPSSRPKAAIDKCEKIPDKFKILSEYFDSLACAIRLSRLKGLSSDFSNIRPKIECLTDRSFTYGHLAQLKFILPEVIKIKKVLIFDQRTSCMKPDLQISLNSSVLNSDDSETGSWNLRLSKLFHARLSEFVRSHSEDDEVPKELLPEPFNRSGQDLFPKTTSKQPATSSTNIAEGNPLNHSEESQYLHVNASESISSMRIVTGPSKQEKFVGASHLPGSFSRRFSEKFIHQEVVNDRATKPCAQESSHSDAEASVETVLSNVEYESKDSSPVKLPSNPTCTSNCFENYASPLRLSTPPLPITPSNMVGKGFMTKDDDLSAKINDIESTPTKFVSTPVRLMVNTPAIPPPKRSYMSPDDDSTFSTNKLVRRPPRSLIFDTPTKKEKNDNETDDYGSPSLLDVLPMSLLQSIREKEKKAKEEQMPAISQAKRRQELIAGLPRLFDAILCLFNKRTIITKAELIYKIIAGSSHIVDRRETEEQLNLLMELVPEWISENATVSGDLLLCINKVSSAEMMARLEEVK